MNSEDHFDSLPDAILLLVFTKLRDAKSLTRCLAVSTRFASLVPQSDIVSFSVPSRRRVSSKTSLLKLLVNRLFKEPIRCLRRAVGQKAAERLGSGYGEGDLYYSPEEVLKNFRQIRDLRMEVPLRRDIGGAGGCVVRWRADFGSQIWSCVVVGADSLERTNQKFLEEPNRPRTESVSRARCDLESRIVWTISCLIDSSSRHYLAKQIAAERPLLRRVEITDGGGHGRLCMGAHQEAPSEEERSMGRTAVPDLRMKMWYVPALELPEAGCVMKGATLVVITPATVDGKVKTQGWVKEAFDGEEENVFGEALRLMIKMNKTHTLEMTSF